MRSACCAKAAWPGSAAASAAAIVSGRMLRIIGLLRRMAAIYPRSFLTLVCFDEYRIGDAESLEHRARRPRQIRLEPVADDVECEALFAVASVGRLQCQH